MKYISQPPLLLDVHIHKPLLPARTWMDSLLAFFPGLQVRLESREIEAFIYFCGVPFLSNTVHFVDVHGSGVEGRYPSRHRDS